MAPDRFASLRRETPRKCLHLASAAIPLSYVLLSKPVVLAAVAGLVALAVAMETARRTSPRVNVWLLAWFGSLFRDRERGSPTDAHGRPAAATNVEITGATWVVIGALLALLFFPRNNAVAALLVMSVSDALAALVGRAVGGRKLAGKTPAGSAAFWISATVILRLTCALPWPMAVLIAAALTLVEATPVRVGRLKLSDNVLIPLAAGMLLHFT